MAEKINEQLSALVDGEYEQAELDLLFRRVSRDSALKDRWERYHFISDTIQQHLPETVNLDFSRQVMAAIADDEVDSEDAEVLDEESPATYRTPWLRPLIGFALAASVASVTVVNIDLDSDSVADADPQVDNSTSSPAALDPGVGGFDTPQFDQRLSAYLVNHSEYVSMNGVNGVIPYVRMVGYQAGY